MAFFYNEFSTVIGTTEYSMVANTTVGVPTSQTSEGQIQVIVNILSMAAGDEFQVQLYEKVLSAGSQIVIDSWRLSHPLNKLVLPALIVHNAWDVTIKKISGTDRTIETAVRRSA